MNLLEPVNLPFVLPFIAGLIYVVLMAFGTMTPGEDVELETELDVEVDLEVDHEVAGTGLEHVISDHDTEHDVESGLIRVLSILGIGKVPLSIVIMSFCFVWGFVGWASNTLIGEIIPYPAVYLPISVTAAFICAVFFTRYLAIGLAKVMPKTETYGVSTKSLVGRSGEVRYTITTTFGAVTVRDQYGTRHEIAARLSPGQDPIPQGTTVILYEYHQEQGGYFTVVTEGQFDDLKLQFEARRHRQ